MTTKLVHFIYNPHTAVNNWDHVTCPDCLAHRPQPSPPEDPPISPTPPIPPALAKALGTAPDLLTTTILIRWFREHPDVFDAAIEAIRPLPPVKTRYTAGFAFHGNATALLLINKERGPKSVRGKLNAIGGKIEGGETPVQCQRREFLEETGLDIPEERWTETVVLRGHNNGGWLVFFFKAELTDDEAGSFRTAEDEEVRLEDVREMVELKIVPNLRWLVPMQLDRHLEWPLIIQERAL